MNFSDVILLLGGMQLLMVVITWFGLMFGGLAVLTSKRRNDFGTIFGFLVCYAICAPAALFYAAFAGRETR